MTATIWHNPRCSKSRQTLQLLRDRGYDPQVVDYQKTPPSTDEILEVLKLLGLKPIELMRTKEAVFKELQLSKSDDDETLVEAMRNYPILIERPIVMNEGKAAIGRPPESVLPIL